MEETPEITIRPLEPGDVEAAVQLLREGLGDYDTLDYDEDLSDLDPVRIEDVYGDPKGRFWVAVSDGAIVGTAAFRRLDDRVCIMKRFSVQLDFRKHDVPQKMLKVVEEYAGEAGFRRAIAETTARQKPAQLFYRAADYSEFKRLLRQKNVIVSFEKTL